MLSDIANWMFEENKKLFAISAYMICYDRTKHVKCFVGVE